jgi:hypothetical protein
MSGEHSGHCRACKERVGDMLTALFGACLAGRQFPWPARPEEYAATPVGAPLQRIRDALGDWRGHRDFIKSAQMPPCDFYVADPPFILEFDESQHFSRARAVTLAMYPESIPVQFSVARWRALCEVIDAADDLPFDRDERRAWYDTLRDLAPFARGLGPTVRLYAGAQKWCALDPRAAHDRALFRAAITAEPSPFR